MQLTQKPALITVPFANSAGPSYIRTIPVPSQISIEAGAASWTDGFPPLNFTPVEGGGVPPFGQDMNGVLNNISAALRWQEAGGGAYYDSAFSTAIGGYPNKAVLVKADNTGFWANTVDNNLTNPDTGGAGWVTVTGVDYLTKSIAGGSNVTLTADEAAKRTILLTGVITANIQVTVPTGVKSWVFRNATTGAFTVTIKQATGTGVVVKQGYAAEVMSDGTNVVYANATADTAAPGDNSKLIATTEFVTAAIASSLPPLASATGTADAITATFSPAITLANGIVVYVRTTTPNTITTPTFNANALGAKTIVKGNNAALSVGDCNGWMSLQYNSTLDKWVLKNPIYGVLSQGLVSKSINYVTTNQTISTATLGGTVIAAHAAGLLSLTLPALSGVADGQRIEIFNQSGSTSGAFVVANTGESIIVNSFMFTNPSGLIIYEGDTLTLERVSSTQWLAISGTGQLRYSESFRLVSNIGTPQTGYKKEPNGWITQWGAFLANATPGAPLTVTFPITFPTLLANVFMTPTIIYTGIPTQYNTTTWTDGAASTSQFKAYCNLGGVGIIYLATGR